MSDTVDSAVARRRSRRLWRPVREVPAKPVPGMAAAAGVWAGAAYASKAVWRTRRTH